MNRSTSLLRGFGPAAVLAFICLTPNLNAGQIFIDTDFSLASADGTLETAGKPVDAGQLPLKAPTRATALTQSTLKAATEPLGDLKPPYALVTLGPSEANPEVTGYGSLQWDLREMALETGRFKLTYQIASLAAGVAGGKLNIGLVDEAGKSISAHPTQWPLQVFFNKERLQATYSNPGVPYGETQLFTVEITVDLDKKIWSATADGQPLVTDLPFAEAYQQAAALRISVVELSAGSTSGDTAGSGYAIAQVKLIQLD